MKITRYNTSKRAAERKIIREKPNEKSGKRLYPPYGRRYYVKDSADLTRFSMMIINDVLQQKIHRDDAKTVLYGAQVVAGLMKATIVEERVNEFEKFLKENHGYGG